EDGELLHGVRFLKRWALGTRYTKIVREVCALAEKPPFDWPRLIVDGTGVGQAVVDMFRVEDMFAEVKPVLITGGSAVNVVDGSHHIPKKELVSALQVGLGSGRLQVAEDLPEARILRAELGTFKVKVNTATGHESFEAWRERDHDDLVLAVALACWFAERRPAVESEEPAVAPGWTRPGTGLLAPKRFDRRW